MEVLYQTACLWQTYTIGDLVPEKAFRLSIQADGPDYVSVYMAKQGVGPDSTYPWPWRIFHIHEKGDKIWSELAPLHKKSKSKLHALSKVGSAGGTASGTSILVCEMKRGIPRWQKFTPKLELRTCVSVDQDPFDVYYLGRGGLINPNQTKTFAIGTFSPSDGLLVMRSGNFTQVTDAFEVLCVTMLGRTIPRASLEGR